MPLSVGAVAAEDELPGGAAGISGALSYMLGHQYFLSGQKT